MDTSKARRGQTVSVVAWLLTVLTMVLAVIVWGQSLHWHIWRTSTYVLFPVFGLLVFSVLWSQYMALALRYLFRSEQDLRRYFAVTGYLVLVGILLHPGLLVWQLWRDGFGLPPGSYVRYVGPGLKAFVLLGTVNLVVLLLFELRRVFAKRSWWKYMTYLVDVVMFSIFIHALKLGTQLQHGWYRMVWFFYGATLLIALGIIYVKRWQAHTHTSA